MMKSPEKDDSSGLMRKHDASIASCPIFYYVMYKKGIKETQNKYLDRDYSFVQQNIGS